MRNSAVGLTGYEIPGLIKQPLENAHHIFDAEEVGSEPGRLERSYSPIF